MGRFWKEEIGWLDGGGSNSCGEKAFNLKELDLAPNRKRISLETCSVWVWWRWTDPRGLLARGVWKGLFC